MDTIYGQLVFAATAITGAYILFAQKGRYHTIMWLVLCFMLIGLGVAQEALNNNSVPVISGAFAVLAGHIALRISMTTKTYWPLWIAAFMVVILIGDAAFLVFDIAGVELGGSTEFAYQSLGNVMHYCSLLALCVHPRIIRRHADQYNWIYS